MPIYEYACPACHTTFEEWLKTTDDTATHPCPKCGATAQHIISATSFILKGSGWYVTEYGSHHIPDHEPEHENAASENAAQETAAPKNAAQDKTAPAAKNEAGSESKAGKAAAKVSDAPKAKPAENSAPQAKPAKSARAAV